MAENGKRHSLAGSEASQASEVVELEAIHDVKEQGPMLY
jgi:hypothetical protein